MAAKMSWNAYWYGSKDSRYQADKNEYKDGGFDKSVPWCWSQTAAGDDKDAGGPYIKPENRNLCSSEKMNDGTQTWIYQGRVRKHTGWTGVGGQADADIYFSEDGSKCYVAIAGTDDIEDGWTDLRSANYAWIEDANGMKTYKVGKGFKRYYLDLQATVKDACKDKIVYVTGHSLGAAAADIMHAYGDAVQSITFGTPKAFDYGAKGVIGRSGKTDMCNIQGEPGNKLGDEHSLSVASLDIYAHNTNNHHYDIVAAVPPGYGAHCAREVFELQVPASSSDAAVLWQIQGPKAPNSQNPPEGKARMDVHPMPMSYLPYLYGGCYGGYRTRHSTLTLTDCPAYDPNDEDEE